VKRRGKGFREFITKGNLLQLAVAFVMGVAFSTMVGSFVNDLIMPIIGKLVGNVDFANLYVTVIAS
jgi:large conductance mechanosensitive channel